MVSRAPPRRQRRPLTAPEAREVPLIELTRSARGAGMGLRTALGSGSEQETRGLLADCFGLAGDDLDSVMTALRQRF